MTLKEGVEVLKELKLLCYPDSIEGTLRAERNNEALDLAIGVMVMGQEYLDEQKQGKWIFDCERTGSTGWTYPQYHCSVCGFQTEGYRFNFCPNCGAKMS